MIRFIKRSLFFLLLVGCSCLYVFSRAGGVDDAFYLRFTSPVQNSLILGTSRAAQGLQPRIINRHLSRNDVYNYSFTINQSPYGPVYLKSIRRKLNPQSKNGIFILTVDPWSITSDPKNPNDPQQFREKGRHLDNTFLVNIKPNPLYLIHHYDKKFFSLLLKKSRRNAQLLHKDGWLEITIPMDSASIKKREQRKFLEYTKDILPVHAFSEVRLNYLRKTIHYLQSHGTVCLVRLPVHPNMMKIENKLMADFNIKMQNLARKTRIKYLDMTHMNPRFIYLDGNHLYKESGKEVSYLVANWISQEIRP